MVVGGKAPILRVLFVYLGGYLLLFVAGAGLAYGAYTLFGEDATLPPMPVSIVGAALSIFLGFRTNAAYGRYWEARTLWGRVINGSRHFAHQVVAYFPADRPGASEAAPLRATGAAAELITRQAAYAHVLRCHCRGQDPLDDEHVARLLTDGDRRDLAATTNAPAALARRSLACLGGTASRGEISEERLRSLDSTLRALLDAQGGCERILKTPLPVSYGYYARRLTVAYALMLPWALVSSLGPLTLVVAPSVALVFLLIDNAGEIIETPFSMITFGLPLSSMSLTVERNLRELVVGLDELPEPEGLQGPNRTILM